MVAVSLTLGSGVVTTRADVHYVVTEYGIASLRGKSIRDRALALIDPVVPQALTGKRLWLRRMGPLIRLVIWASAHGWQRELYSHRIHQFP